MSRSLWKGPFSEQINHKKRTIRIWSRRSMILPSNLGKEFLVYNGKGFISVKIVEDMCSCKFGEFAVTRKKPSHKFNKRKQLHKKSAKRATGGI